MVLASPLHGVPSPLANSRGFFPEFRKCFFIVLILPCNRVDKFAQAATDYGPGCKGCNDENHG